MTQAEVEAILGGAPGDFTTEALAYGTPFLYDYDASAGDRATRWEHWSANQGRIDVAFDGQGSVLYSAFYPAVVMGPDSPAGWVRRLLRRVWP
jgi:hypothetical protein